MIIIIFNEYKHITMLTSDVSYKFLIWEIVKYAKY